MEEVYDCLKLQNQLCFPIYLLSKEIIKKYTPYLNKINLTYTQYVVMMYFWEKKKSNVKEISNILLIDSSTLTPLLKKLEQKGFIKRSRSTIDERNLSITITKEGEQLKEKAKVIPEKVGKCLNLSSDELVVFHKLIYKTLENVIKNNE